MNATPTHRVRVTLLCWLAVIFDGYDLIVYGTVLPVLKDEPGWHLDQRALGAVGAAAFLGMLIGAIVTGVLTDLVGRRRPMLFSLAWFSVCMIGCAVAPTPGAFAVARFAAGLGLGGLIPTASALISEFAPARHRTLVYAITLSGIPLGGVVAALTAMPILHGGPGWRTMFWIGAAPLLLLPVVWRLLPESPAFLSALDRSTARAESSRSGGRTVLAAPLFWIATFMALLTWYGLGTWLPGIMREAGYDLTSALSALLVLAGGGIIGSCAAAAIGDRAGHKPVAIVAFLVASASLGLLGQQPSRLALYVLLAIAGAAAVSCQVLINSYVVAYYPVTRRASALGWALGIGRLGAIVGPLLAGALLAAHQPHQAVLYAFAIAALIGGVCIAAVPSRHRTVAARSPLSGVPTVMGPVTH